MSRLSLATLVAVALLLCSAGCGGPFLVFPGGALRGEVVSRPGSDWSFLDTRFVELETRPSDPYSVQLNYIVKDGELYIDPSEGKTWLEHIRADRRVRARFGSRIYELEAVLVGEPSRPLEGFDPSRFVYRLDPRP